MKLKKLSKYDKLPQKQYIAKYKCKYCTTSFVVGVAALEHATMARKKYTNKGTMHNLMLNF